MKYCNISIKLDPLLELALCIGQTALMVHGRNSGIAAARESEPMNAEADLSKEVQLDFE